MVLEYIIGVTTLQAIFTIHWLALDTCLSRAIVKGQCPKCSDVRLIRLSNPEALCAGGIVANPAFVHHVGLNLFQQKIATDKWAEERLSDLL